eukprot:32720_1
MEVGALPRRRKGGGKTDATDSLKEVDYFTDLKELVAHACELTGDDDDAIARLAHHPFQNKKDWEKVSRNFLPARSFTLFRTGSTDNDDDFKAEVQRLFSSTS